MESLGTDENYVGNSLQSRSPQSTSIHVCITVSCVEYVGMYTNITCTVCISINDAL